MNATVGTARESTGIGAARAAARGWWATRAPREKQLIVAAGSLVLLALIWLLAVQPAWRTLRAAPALSAQLDTQWQQMQRQAAEARALRAAPPLAPGLAAQALQAATARLGPSARLTLQGERAVLTLTGTDGDALLAWLTEARRGARARPLEATLKQSGDGYSGSIVVALGETP